MKLAGIYMAGMALLLFTGCDDQRDLYSTALSALKVECDWVPSLNKENMQEATVLFYKDGSVATREYFSNPGGISARVTQGDYNILSFNGIMESESEANLNFIFFRGTSLSETFEVCAAEGNSLSRLVRTPEEYIANNNMELFARAYCNVAVEGTQGYFMKYKNGENTNMTVQNHIGHVVQLVPQAVSFRFQVKLSNLVNASSARSASAALRGFMGSLILVTDSGLPNPGFYATHHLSLTPSSNGQMQANTNGQDVGKAQSPLFVSFGPPIPESLDNLPNSGQFSLELGFLLTDNTEFLPECCPIDITPQVNTAIDKIFRYHKGLTDLDFADNLFIIEITDPIVLPVIVPENIVEVEDWEDSEEIMVWIK